MNLSNHKNKLTIIRRAGIRLISFGVISIFICVFIAMNFIAIASPKQAVASECSNNGDISGTVFYDYNNNGFQDDDEPGIGGVIVSGYISSSTGLLSGGTACESRADGSYNFTQTQFPVRLEFTLSKELETYLKPGPTNFDVGTGSTVQVVNAPSISINVGYHDPADYCGNNVEFGTTCFTYGVSTNITTPQEAVVSINYFEPAPVEIGVDVRFPAADQTVRGTTAEVGSVLGLAYHGQRQNLFTAAWVKRHVDLGPNGAGAIYRLDTNSNQTSLFFDLNSLPGSPAGTVENRPDPPVLLWRAVGDPQPHLFYDVDAYLKAGTTGIGDIDLSPDEKTLFAVNMADKKLYLLPGDPFATVTVNDVSSVAIPNTCPNPADARPMALGYNNGKMYVGSICTAESVVDLEVSPFYTRTNNITFVNSAEFETIFADSFYAEVFEFDIETSAFNSIPVLTAPLIYDRGCAFLLNVETGRGQNPDCSNGSNSINQTSNWRPWQSNWREVYDDATNSGETRVSSGFTLEYPQPILADIEFDGEDMILGLRDIHADRTGHAMGAPDTISPPGGFNVTVPFRTAGLGDILRACWDESSASWQLESNATCGGVTTAGTNEGEGLNGGEFYWDDSTPGGPNNIGANSWIDNGVNNMGHSEGGMGMLMHVPGRNQTVASAIDISEFYDAGLIWFNDETGASDKRVKLFSAPFIFNGDSLLRENGGLKAANANSIGDIEAFCAAAPIEIGNLIWLDENQNGLQDPGESGAAGVTVQLFSEFDTSSSLATAVTDANGNYIFSSGEGSNSTSAVYNINIDPETTYRVIVEKNQAGTPIENRLVTTANSISDANGDMRDSDAISTVQNGLPVAQVLFTTGSIGENDHSFDIGFYEEQINPPPPVDACGSLLNGGFEEGFNHWIEQGTWEIVPGRTGNGIAISQEYINQMISAEGSADFVLSGYYKLEGHNSQADNGSSSWSGIGLDYLQNGNEVGESLAHFTADTNGFVYFEISGTTTPDTDEISLWIFSNFGAVLTIDDLELTWTNCDTDPPPPPPACGPLLNGGFEDGFNHWTEQGAWEIVPGRSGNGIAISQEYINQMIAAGKNSDFILSGYYKLEGHNSQAANGSTSWSGVGVDYLQDGTKVGEALAHFTADTDGFVYFEINGTTTPDTDGIEVWIFSNFGAVLTVDNLELTWSNCDPDIDPPPPAEACGPLLNGGFEDGFNHWEEHGAWEIVPGRTGNGIQVTQNYVSQSFPAVENASFKLSGYFTVEGFNDDPTIGNTTWVGIGTDHLQDGVELKETVKRINGDTNGYTYFEYIGYTTESGTDEIELWIFSNFGAVLTVDDLELTWANCD